MISCRHKGGIMIISPFTIWYFVPCIMKSASPFTMPVTQWSKSIHFPDRFFVCMIRATRTNGEIVIRKSSFIGNSSFPLLNIITSIPSKLCMDCRWLAEFHMAHRCETSAFVFYYNISILIQRIVFFNKYYSISPLCCHCFFNSKSSCFFAIWFLYLAKTLK